MAGYIIQDREQMLTLPARQVDALLDLSDGDAALLYLCLMRVEGAVTPEQLMEKLHLSALRLQAAQTKLEKLGLIRAQALPVPEPPRRPAEFTDRELGDLLRDGEFQMLVEETERALGKKLTTMDLKRLASLHREVGLPADVIFLLVRHCVENQELRYGPGRRPTVAFIERRDTTGQSGACLTRNPPPGFSGQCPSAGSGPGNTWPPCKWGTAGRWRRRRSTSASGWTGAFPRRWWPLPTKKRC